MIKDLLRMIKYAFTCPSLSDRVDHYMKHPKKEKDMKDLREYYFGKQPLKDEDLW